MQKTLHKWLMVAIINLNIVAFLGVVLRYKIAFSLPFVDQKHLLHGHSHFAFAGWVTQIIMTLMVVYLYKRGLANSFKKYFWLLFSNLITAYGMLIAFPIQGYGVYSIIFSTLSIFVSYLFAVIYWRDLNKVKSTSSSHLWFKAAVVFNALSSIGAFGLAFMMVKHIIHQNWYLSAVYFFLHFQYNGWFFFACMGLLVVKLESHKTESKLYKEIFWLFFLSCFPAYFLSTLWMHLPVWIYILVVLSAIAQVVAWFLLTKAMFHHLDYLNRAISTAAKFLFSLAAFALSLKFLLQLGSTYPPLSTLAFGFRPIVIAYLHLVLLGVITIFIIGYIVANHFVVMNRKSIIGISTFVVGIVANEILLMAQGVTGLKYESVPYTNELLLVAAIIMFTGILLFALGQFQKKQYDIYHILPKDILATFERLKF